MSKYSRNAHSCKLPIHEILHCVQDDKTLNIIAALNRSLRDNKALGIFDLARGFLPSKLGAKQIFSDSGRVAADLNPARRYTRVIPNPLFPTGTKPPIQTFNINAHEFSHSKPL